MKWISAQDLKLWAETHQCRDNLPKLVEDLIWATATKIRRLRFLHGDNGQIRGFDGFVDADATPPFVPEGKSIWEFGSSDASKSKAEADYKKRTEETDEEERIKHTLVIVSPRTWDTPTVKVEDWLREKNRQCEWKKVVYLDGPLLESWLEQCPAVSSNWARFEFNKTFSYGVRSTDEFWETFSSRFNPALVEEVLLAGRESQAEDLLKKLLDRTSSGRLAFAADTTDEVIAFVVAAIRKAPEPVRKELEAHTLIIDTEEAARQIVQKGSFIYLPRLKACNCMGMLKDSGPTVISAGIEIKKSDHIVLMRPTSTQLGNAFIGMGMSASEGYEAARKCGRSLAVLARQKPSGNSELPKWVDDRDNRNMLIPAMLAGAWNCNTESDQKILSLLSQKSYEETEDALREFLVMPDSPIEYVGGLWATRAPVDAFLHLAPYVGRNHLKQFKCVLKEVFQVAAALHKPPTADQPFVILSKHDQQTSHSEHLRNGLMTTLLQMAVLHELARFTVAGSDPQTFVDEIVRSIPGLASDPKLMASLNQDLMLLAEASPEPFLEALECQLEGTPPSILPIFDEHPGMLMPVTYHSGLLWALEVIAWDAKYFDRAALCLAKLAALDPGGKLKNRPINSLRAIFLSWAPCTSVNTAHRLAILQSTLGAVPSIAWPLLASLLPCSNDTTSITQKPKFREYEQYHGEQLTYGVVWESEEKIIRLAIEAAGSVPERWGTLIDRLSNFQQDIFEVVVDRLNSVLNVANTDAQTQIWKALNVAVKRHQKYSSMGWAMPKDRIDHLVPIINKYAPEMLVENYTWLFDDEMPPVDGIENKCSNLTELIENSRLQAIDSIYNELGTQGILQLVGCVKNPTLVILCVLSLELSYEESFTLFTGLLTNIDRTLQVTAGIVMANGITRFESKWQETARTALQQNALTVDHIASVLKHILDSKQTWSYVESFGDEIAREYWTKKSPRLLDGGVDELLYAVDKYREVGRPSAALYAVLRRLSEIPTQKIILLLEEKITEQNVNSGDRSIGGVFNADKLIKELAKRPDAAKEKVAGLEFAYFPLLRQDPEILHQMLLEQPRFFMQMVCLVFKSQDTEPEPLSDEQKNRASVAYRLLCSLKSLPGQTGEEIDYDVLLGWCVELRRLGGELHRQDITDQLIGQVLAHAPTDPKDGAWPHEAVRFVIEKLASSQVETGLRTEKYNMRDGFAKMPEEGGDQERVLAEQVQKWAQASCRFVRTHAMLNLIAKSWLEDARREDMRVEQYKLRY